MQSIVFEDVSKTYRQTGQFRLRQWFRKSRAGVHIREKGFLALDHTSFSVREGEIFGLLGPNGAGKTTAINIIIGLLAGDHGTIRVQGYDPVTEWKAVRQLVGVVPQETALYPELSAVQNLEFHAALYVKDLRNIAVNIREILRLVELEERRNDPVGTYSGGMKRRLAIGKALLHDPRILLLDEPTLGVDVQGTHRIWDYIKRLASSGKTILVTTNVMSEADYLCDRILILDRGKNIALGSPRELKNTLGDTEIIIATAEKYEKDQLSGLIQFPFEIKDHKIIVAAQKGEEALVRIIQRLSKQIAITGVEMKTPTLDDVFLYYTGRSLRD